MMKRGIVLLALLMLCLLTACGSKNTLKADSLIRDNTGIDPDSFVYLDAGVWPENEYTEELPVPPGTVNTAYIDTTNEFLDSIRVRCCLDRWPSGGSISILTHLTPLHR